MNKENRKYMVPTLFACALMFVWIFVTVFLTGSREISDFTETDKIIFTGFIVIELSTLAFIIICITKAQKLVNNNVNVINTVKKPIDKRRLTINIASFIVITATLFAGIFAKKHLDNSLENLYGIIAVTALLLPVLFLVLNIIIHRIYTKNLSNKSVAENQQYWVSHRNNPEETTSKKLITTLLL